MTTTIRPRSRRWPGGIAPGRKPVCSGSPARPPGAAAGEARRLAGRGVRTMAVALALAGLTGAGAPGGVPASACAGRPQPPNPSGFGNALFGVAVLSRCSAWAVGGYSIGSTDQTLIVHWNGTRWRQVGGPNPSGDDQLNAVAGTSSRNIWAVGQYSNGTNDQALIAHWGGARWRQVPSPNPGGPANFNALYAVAALSARNVWAVGSYSIGNTDRTLIVHWNGTRWRRVPSPSGSSLDGVAGASSRNVWAVGEYSKGITTQTLTVHWNGTRWRRVPSPDPGSRDRLLGVAIPSRASALATGYYTNGTAFRTLIMRWDGTRWRRVPSPDPGGPAHDNFLYSVAASAGSAWAVGQYSNGALFKTLAIRCC